MDIRSYGFQGGLFNTPVLSGAWQQKGTEVCLPALSFGMWKVRSGMIQQVEKGQQPQDGPTSVSPMDERARLKGYAERWKRLGPLLEAQREEDVRRSDTISNIAAFGRLYAMAVAASPPPPTSGLVEQQRWFAKLRRP
jgi:hypothetical protein